MTGTFDRTAQMIAILKLLKLPAYPLPVIVTRSRGEKRGGSNDAGGNRNEIANRLGSPTTGRNNKDSSRDPDDSTPSTGESACLKVEDIDNPFHQAS